VEFVVNMAETFAVAVIATTVVGLLAKLAGAKPNWLNLVAIAVGISVAEAILLEFALSTFVKYLVIGGCVSGCAFVAQVIGRRTKSEA